MATVKITKTSHGLAAPETFVMQSNIMKTLKINLSSPMFVQDLPETTPTGADLVPFGTGVGFSWTAEKMRFEHWEIGIWCADANSVPVWHLGPVGPTPNWA